MTVLLFAFLSIYSQGFQPTDLERQVKQALFQKSRNPPETQKDFSLYKVRKVRMACEIELLNQNSFANCETLIKIWSQYTHRVEKASVLSSLQQLKDELQSKRAVDNYIKDRKSGINDE